MITTLPTKKKTKQVSSDEDVDLGEDSEDEILTALDMSETVSKTLQQILEKLQKLDKIENSLENIETKLQNLELRTERLEQSETAVKQDLKDFKEELEKVNTQHKENMKSYEDKQETTTTDLRKKIKELEDQTKQLHDKNLYLEAYSRRENIKFMNISETRGPTDRKEDTEAILRDFLEKVLGYDDSEEVDIQRVHRIGKGKNGGPRPILARILRYKDCENILSLGRRLKGSNYQMFRDLPTEIIDRRKKQVETLKEARKNGKLWPVGRELVLTERR